MNSSPEPATMSSAALALPFDEAAASIIDRSRIAAPLPLMESSLLTAELSRIASSRSDAYSALRASSLLVRQKPPL